MPDDARRHSDHGAACASGAQAKRTQTSQARTRALPDPPNAVLAEYRVGGNDRAAFFDRLRNEQPVERIAMMKGERCHSRDMPEIDRELAERVRCQLVRYEALDRRREAQLAEAELHGDLPAACET